MPRDVKRVDAWLTAALLDGYFLPLPAHKHTLSLTTEFSFIFEVCHEIR
jgi:hypothetical protein